MKEVTRSYEISPGSMYSLLKEYKFMGELNHFIKTDKKTIVNDTNELLETSVRRKVHSFYLKNIVISIN